MWAMPRWKYSSGSAPWKGLDISPRDVDNFHATGAWKDSRKDGRVAQNRVCGKCSSGRGCRSSAQSCRRKQTGHGHHALGTHWQDDTLSDEPCEPSHDWPVNGPARRMSRMDYDLSPRTDELCDMPKSQHQSSRCFVRGHREDLAAAGRPLSSPHFSYSYRFSRKD